MLDMGGRRSLSDYQPFSDLTVGQPTSHEGRDILLAPSESAQPFRRTEQLLRNRECESNCLIDVHVLTTSPRCGKRLFVNRPEQWSEPAFAQVATHRFEWQLQSVTQRFSRSRDAYCFVTFCV